MGPGSHPETEKKWLDNDSIDFLHQPYAVNGGESYIQSLIDWCEEVLRKRLDNGCQLEVIAHSFGAFLINEQSQDLIDKISKITLIAPTFNFLHSLKQLFYFVAKKDANSLLEKKCNDLDSNPCSLKFWNVFSELCKLYPDFLKFYFYDKKIFDKYMILSNQFAPLDELSLVKGIDDLIVHYNRRPYFLKEMPQAKLFLGEHDPLISKEDREHFFYHFGPNQIDLRPSGHFPHLEESLIY